MAESEDFDMPLEVWALEEAPNGEYAIFETNLEEGDGEVLVALKTSGVRELCEYIAGPIAIYDDRKFERTADKEDKEVLASHLGELKRTYRDRPEVLRFIDKTMQVDGYLGALYGGRYSFQRGLLRLLAAPDLDTPPPDFSDVVDYARAIKKYATEHGLPISEVQFE